MAHPDTYLNKVVLGSEEGQLQVRGGLQGSRGEGAGAQRPLPPARLWTLLPARALGWHADAL